MEGDYIPVINRCIAEIIMAAIPDQTKNLRFLAVLKLQGYLHQYEQRGYMPKLIHAIAEKKCRMIGTITTESEMEKLLKPSCPHYYGGRFTPGEYHIPEEELIGWSEASLRTPLNSAGYQRYMELFKQVLPEESRRLSLGGSADGYVLPMTCPCCGEPLTVKRTSGGTRQLYCVNPHCAAKLVQKFAHFCEKTRMNIEGLSATTLEKLIGHGWVHNFGDLYELERHREEIIKTEGFGEKSFERLQAAIEKSRCCTLAKFIAGLGIPMVGRHAGRDLDKFFHGSWSEFESAILNDFDFTQLPDFGQTMHNNIYTWYTDADETLLWRPLLSKIQFIEKENQTMEPTMNNPFAGKSVVATGKLEHYTREGIQEKLLSLGAHPSNAVSKKTDYLIVGEKAGSKLTKAQQLGVKTLTEQEFEDMLS